MFREQHKKEMPLLGLLGMGGGIARAGGAGGITATGGTMFPYNGYIVHVFTTTGPFSVKEGDGTFE
jgi:hypothetical protein